MQPLDFDNDDDMAVRFSFNCSIPPPRAVVTRASAKCSARRTNCCHSIKNCMQPYVDLLFVSQVAGDIR